MGYECKVITDSLAPSGVRLTTIQVTLPRIVLAELNTHRDFSRNSASSRAIPVEKMLQRVMDDPFIPIYWGKNQSGMQAQEELSEDEQGLARAIWLDARDDAVKNVRLLLSDSYDGKTKLDVHKQIANRLLEPFLWHTVILSATRWSNFFAQRCHPDAQPEIRKAAEMLREAMEQSEPQRLHHGEYHLPYLQPDEQDMKVNDKIALCVARCARVSYLSQGGRRDHEADFALFARLLEGMHFSPLEHVAMAHSSRFRRSGNFHGWLQYRKQIKGEYR